MIYRIKQFVFQSNEYKQFRVDSMYNGTCVHAKSDPDRSPVKKWKQKQEYVQKVKNVRLEKIRINK